MGKVSSFCLLPKPIIRGGGGDAGDAADGGVVDDDDDDDDGDGDDDDDDAQEGCEGEEGNGVEVRLRERLNFAHVVNLGQDGRNARRLLGELLPDLKEGDKNMSALHTFFVPHIMAIHFALFLIN